MATIKAYTDLEQSKKLAEILPPESADMWWNYYSVTTDFGTTLIFRLNTPWVGSFNWNNKPDNIPCWSLTALLNLIPDSIYENTDNFAQLEITKRSLGYHDINDNIVIGTLAGNPVDACYEMIIKLYEKNLL